MNNTYTNICKLKSLPKHGGNDEDINFENIGLDKATVAVKERVTKFRDDVQAILNKLDSITAIKGLEATINALDRAREVTKSIITIFDVLEQRALGVGEGFNISTKRAIDFANKLDDISTKVGANADASKEYILDLKKLVPGLGEVTDANTRYYKEAVLANDILRDKLKLSSDEAVQIRSLTRLQNRELIPSIASYIETARDFSDQGIMGSFNIFAEALAGTQSNVLAQYSKVLPSALMKTTVEAKRLGLSLDDIYKTGEGMLDIQKQTEASYRFQLVTGKALEGAQYKNVAAAMNRATVERDVEEQLRIIKDVTENLEDEILANPFARKEVASSLNMTESKLVDIIKLRREQGALTAKDIKNLKLTQQATDDLAEIEQVRSFDVVDRVAATSKAEKVKETGLTGADFDLNFIEKLVGVPGGSTGIFPEIEKFLSDTTIGELTVDVMVIKGVIEGISQAAAGGKKATGGPVAAGRTYMVGELGPELFSPATAGNITPNNRLAGGGNGGTRAIIDALKGVQFNVINKFDGSDILTSIQYAEGNTLT